jgi:hypothetical protein
MSGVGTRLLLLNRRLRALAGHHQSSSVAFASAHWTVRGPVHAKLSEIPTLV